MASQMKVRVRPSATTWAQIVPIAPPLLTVRRMPCRANANRAARQWLPCNEVVRARRKNAHRPTKRPMGELAWTGYRADQRRRRSRDQEAGTTQTSRTNQANPPRRSVITKLKRTRSLMFESRVGDDHFVSLIKSSSLKSE